MSKKLFAEVGFPYPENLLMWFEGGSRLHGAKLEGTDDTDWYGCYVEPKEKILGIDTYEHFVFTTGGERGGNKPDDVDVTLYSLRKLACMLCKGNPSALHYLFAPEKFCHVLWGRLRLQRNIFLSKRHLGQFLGYANAQLRRLYNGRAKDVNRPFLEEQFGYDTKFAMHIIRLMGEAKELMETGVITLPRPNADELIAIRKGQYKLYEFEKWANGLEKDALAAAEKSPLPERIDRAAISALISQIYLEFWETNRA